MSQEDFLSKYRKMVPVPEWSSFLEHYQKPLRKSLRVNTLKISVVDFMQLAKQANWQLKKVPWCPEGFFVDRVDRSIPLGSTWQHAAGLFYIQEAASMLPVSKVQQENPTYILDLCSAPGSKTTQLTNRFPKSLIVANEVDRKRAIALKQNLTRQGVTNVIILSVDAAKLAHFLPNFFDLVLVDAPCSGEGMIRKNPKVLEFWDEKKIEYMAGIQKRISKEALKTLKPEGELIYSTCTYAPEENEEVLAELDGEITDMQRIWPQDFDTGGFFVARVSKDTTCHVPAGEDTADLQHLHPKQQHHFPARSDKPTWQSLEKNQVLLIQNKLRKFWGIDLEHYLEDYVIMQYEQELRLIPQAVTDNKLHPLVSKAIQVGIELGALIRDEFILSHSAAIALGNTANRNVLELSISNTQQLNSFLSGRDLQIKKTPQETKQLIVKYQGFPLGIMKIVGEKLKNQLPRDFRIS